MESAPKSMAEHFDVIWPFLLVTLSALYGITRWISHFYIKKVNELEKHMVKLLPLIPRNVWDGKSRIMTDELCDAARAKCTNVIIVSEIESTLKVIKQAVLVLVLHSDSIPKEDRDKMAKNLIE